MAPGGNRMTPIWSRKPVRNNFLTDNKDTRMLAGVHEE